MVPNKRNFEEIRTPCSNQIKVAICTKKKILILIRTESEIFSDFIPISVSYEEKIPTLKLRKTGYFQLYVHRLPPFCPLL